MEINQATLLLWKCWKAGHREGWQDGETNDEVFEEVANFLADELGPHWGMILSRHEAMEEA